MPNNDPLNPLTNAQLASYIKGHVHVLAARLEDAEFRASKHLETAKELRRQLDEALERAAGPITAPADFQRFLYEIHVHKDILDPELRKNLGNNWSQLGAAIIVALADKLAAAESATAKLADRIATALDEHNSR